MEQLNFIPTVDDKEDDSLTAEVEVKCREVALECATILIGMATGEIKMNKERRLACLDVLNIAYRTKFRSGGRPRTRQHDIEKDKTMYADLMKSLAN